METELLEKTSTPAYKRCGSCSGIKILSDFSRNKTHKDGLQEECRVCSNEYGRQWRMAHPDYSEQWRRTHPDYFRQWFQKYYNTPWGYAMFQEKSERDILSGQAAICNRERYHAIQDEAGCHRSIQDFYPAYRLLKALEHAEVVEIKG